MRVFIAGGTGTLGRPTIRLLRAAGHEVHALARTAERCAPLRELGAEPVVGDLFDLRAMTETLAGMDAVLHLATRIPPLTQMRKLAAWRDNDRLRSQGASVLVSAAIAAKATIYLQESITFLYQSMGDTQLFETAPLDAPQPLASAREAERETARFTARGGQGIVLRFGAFYGADAPSTRDTVKLARRRMFPIIGSGDPYFSSIHVDAAAAAVVAALAIPSSTTSRCRCGTTWRPSRRRSVSSRRGTCPSGSLVSCSGRARMRSPGRSASTTPCSKPSPRGRRSTRAFARAGPLLPPLSAREISLTKLRGRAI